MAYLECFIRNRTFFAKAASTNFILYQCSTVLTKLMSALKNVINRSTGTGDSVLFLVRYNYGRFKSDSEMNGSESTILRERTFMEYLFITLSEYWQLRYICRTWSVGDSAYMTIDAPKWVPVNSIYRLPTSVPTSNSIWFGEGTGKRSTANVCRKSFRRLFHSLEKLKISQQ